MERNIKERVSQYVDENKVKEKLTQFFQEKIVNRKAMFIPITGVATFMLVGYAAVFWIQRFLDLSGSVECDRCRSGSV